MSVVNQSAQYYGHEMRPWQKDCASLMARFIVLALHRRAGKTELALKKLLTAARFNRKELPQYAYVAPLLKQAKIIAWARLKQMIRPWMNTGQYEINESELFIRYVPTGALIRIVGADNPDAMRGWRLDGCVIDETAQVKPEVWEDIIRPALADRQGWAWFLGTPKGQNLFSELFFKANHLEGWESRAYTCYDTDALPASEVELMRQGMSETTFAREMLCDFYAEGDDQLLSLMDVENAARRILTHNDYAHAPLIIGVDPARFGSDRTVVTRRQGLHVSEPVVYRGLDNMEVAARVSHMWEDYKPDAVFIDSGAGAGIIDRLRQVGYDPIEVSFGGKAIKEKKYVNKRTEMWYEMAEWLKSGGKIPNNTDLKLELATPTYKYDKQDKIVLESKDDIKKRMPGNASPDIADSLALTFAQPVHKKELIDVYREQAAARNGDYDPYSSLGSY